MQDIDSQVAKLWKAGKTSTDIAYELGITRSAVMGRVGRLRKRGLLDFRTGPLTGPAKRKTSSLPRTGGKRMPFVMPDYPGKPIRRRKGFDVPKTKVIEPQVQHSHVTLMELQGFHCRYIVGQNYRGTLYCGEPKAVKSYCEAHAKLCYHVVANLGGEKKPRRKVTGLLLKK